MTSEAVAELVRKQIAGRWDTTNAHRVDLNRCLVPPVRIPVVATLQGPNGSAQASTVKDVWLVLEEEPETKDGYKIVYEEDADTFGLACEGLPTESYLVYLGSYGDFMTTLGAM